MMWTVSLQSHEGPMTCLTTLVDQTCKQLPGKVHYVVFHLERLTSILDWPSAGGSCKAIGYCRAISSFSQAELH